MSAIIALDGRDGQIIAPFEHGSVLSCLSSPVGTGRMTKHGKRHLDNST
ncbi:hypothetical protein [Roseateles sp. BYS96W]|uniref:Uncharacterized protein n=1 Tax=Pelomonas nitida TaxID=3299027 RepID=A0ABW7G7K4_9BURK